ncbi:pleckstrin homology domain-containing family G member 7-like isoform X2 [Paramacrobiotus metropolitanus]|uniref:pleckstrin homology domain-containing family G member 7-like isoform X2 n=1 Tax=Paramacrobiotus metropolitanus TaxID=2943436 RepID=UPI002445B339|nr:pleckstrin homology domain-containing family G member 7-like isoform X2 [Paramacrobiotus metropolitanus]
MGIFQIIGCELLSNDCQFFFEFSTARSDFFCAHTYRVIMFHNKALFTIASSDTEDSMDAGSHIRDFFTRSPSTSRPSSPISTPKSSFRKKAHTTLSLDTNASVNVNRPDTLLFRAPSARAVSSRGQAVPKRLLVRKHTRSESNLLDWVLRSKCCISCDHRPSDPAVMNSRLIADVITLTPLYVDPERESLEIRRSMPAALSPLPWATLCEPEYPKWVRDAFRRSLKLPRPGLSKAKSEDTSRSYTIPNLPFQPAATSTSLTEENCDAVMMKQATSQPSALELAGMPTPTSSPKPERKLHSRFSLRSGRHSNYATESSMSDNLLESPSFAESRASSVGSRDSHGDANDRSPAISAQRRRSSIVVIPPMQICPGDLLVYNQSMVCNTKPPKSTSSFEKHLSPGSPDLAGSTISLPNSEASTGEGRKKHWSLMKLFDRSSRSKETGSLEDQLLTLKISEFNDDALMRYKVLHWSDITAMSDDLSEAEVKRREAIWEMFQSELVLLLDHLLVLKHVYLEPLKQLQVEGFMMHVAPEKLFGNLDELCSANYELCADFAEIIERAGKDNEFVSVDRIVELLRKNSLQDFEADRDTAMAFHRYCLNYINALNYLESLRKHDDFNEYEKFCSQDRRCHRLQLTDLLVTPVQHTMKRPLLLREICKHSEKCGFDCTQLRLVLEETESSLRGLDEKINWLRNFEKLQAIQKQLVWPSVIDLQDPKIYVPEVLKQHLAKQPCEDLILSPRRIIVQEGPLFMIENGKPVEMQVFLFDDMLLLTKKRKGLVKKKSSVSEQHVIGSWPNQESSARFVVYKQPMPLDRIMVHDMSPSEQSNPLLKNSLVILHVSRYQQIISAVTLQASNESAKILWLTKLRFAMDRWKTAHLETHPSFAGCGGDTPTVNHFSTVSEF